MTKVRLGVLALFGLALALLVGDVFGSLVVAAILPVAVVGTIGFAVGDRRLIVVVPALVFGLIVSTIGTTALAGGRAFGEFLFAFGPAVTRLFTTSWPSPLRPELVGLTSMLAGVGVGVSQLVGRSDRRRVTALVPMLGVATFLNIAGAGSGPNLLVWSWFLLVGMAYLVVSTKGASLRLPDTQILSVAALAVVVLGAVGVALPSMNRFDPRISNVEALDTFVPPVEEFPSLQQEDPPIPLFELSGDIADVERFRTVVYDRYDGSRWDAGFEFEEIGTVVRADENADHEYRVRFLDGRSGFVPFAGQPVEVDARIAANRERDVVVLLGDPSSSNSIEVSTAVNRDAGPPVVQGFVATPFSDPFASAAEQIVGTTTGLPAQLDALVATMSKDWVLTPVDEAAPLQSKLLDDFVSENHRGGSAQFVAAFVLMANTLGADARMVGGFVTTDAERSDGITHIDSSDLRLWAEVRTESGGWRAYDPVPEIISKDDDPGEEVSAEQGSRQAQQPGNPNIASENDNEGPTPPTTDDANGGVPTWAVAAIAGIGLFLIAVLAIVFFKAVRRWYWMSVGDPARRTRGAWAEATSTLIDAGLSVRESWTDLDIVRGSRTIDGVPTDDVALLAQAARVVAFAPAPPVITDKDLAAGRAAVYSLQRGVRSCRSWRDRTRMRLSVRSVWPTTSTPVLKSRRQQRRPDRKNA